MEEASNIISDPISRKIGMGVEEVLVGSDVSQDLALDRGAFDNRYGFVLFGMGGVLGLCSGYGTPPP